MYVNLPAVMLHFPAQWASSTSLLHIQGCLAAAGLPAGVCHTDSDCSSGYECILTNPPTRFCHCTNGMDTCEPPPANGMCQKKPGATAPQLRRTVPASLVQLLMTVGVLQQSTWSNFCTSAVPAINHLHAVTQMFFEE